jgi:hypothetical protein
MAGEIAINLATELTNTTAEIIPPDANYGWDGSQAVLWENLTLAQWQGGLVTITEAVLATGERTGLYKGDFPAASTLGKFGVRVRNTPSPTPASAVIAVGTIDWNGSREVAYPANLEQLGINASGHVSRVTLVDVCTENTDMRGTDGAYTGTPPSESAISSQVASDLATAHGDGSWETATSVTVSDKTGFKLASDGLDSISTDAPSTSIASWTFRERLVMMFRRAFGKVTMTSDELKTYASDGTTVLSTQPLTDDNTTQTQGEAL